MQKAFKVFERQSFYPSHYSTPPLSSVFRVLHEEEAKDKKSMRLPFKSAIPTSDDSEREDVEGSEAEN